MSASSIRQALGENAPSLPGIIDKMGQDDRFHSNDEKRWSLATEDVEDTESGPKKRRPGTGPITMVNPETDEQRMQRWRRELGPDKKPYQDDE
jgi:hypothetical protein